MSKKISMTQKVANALSTGKNVTVSQIRKIGLAKPHNAIHALRDRGFTIYTNTVKTKNGYETAYRQEQTV